MKPVFVLITAKNCPGCIFFRKNTWKDLKQELEKQNRVEIVTVDLPTTTSKPDTEKYHKDLVGFIGWFPTMSLFPGNRWHNKDSDLIGIIKNGKRVPPDGKIETVGTINKEALSKEDIVKWVDYTLNNDKIFNKNNKNNGNGALKIDNDKYVVPTSGYYAKFKPSKFE
uniref:Thioredoxin-fold protein n=1 Tax=Pithovirus LCPAC302 TaxID=2506593 RepID=A0A481Z8H4_9VIRU|nr:MAG: thioredoxin-fold protein [Pithovirus LCPAC302]